MKIFQLLGQFGERFGDGLGGGGALIAEKIAIPQPDDLAGAEKGQGLQGLAQSGDGSQRLAAVGNGGLDDLVVHAAHLVAPLLVELSGTLLDGEFVFAANEGDGRELF